MEMRSKNNVNVVQIKRTMTTATDLTTFELREEKNTFQSIKQKPLPFTNFFFYILFATIFTIIFVKVTTLKMQKLSLLYFSNTVKLGYNKLSC
jgi:hypothetical protein